MSGERKPLSSGNYISSKYPRTPLASHGSLVDRVKKKGGIDKTLQNAKRNEKQTKEN